MKSDTAPAAESRPRRHVEMEFDTIDDPYQPREKLPEPTMCTDCGAIYHNGHWQWKVTPAITNGTAKITHCTACRRIRDDLPAGYVTISGEFAQQHRDEVKNLIRHVEAHKKWEHSMQRIMSIQEEAGKLLIMTTDIHLARAIGDALEYAYKGELDFLYNKAEYLLQVQWRR